MNKRMKIEQLFMKNIMRLVAVVSLIAISVNFQMMFG